MVLMLRGVTVPSMPASSANWDNHRRRFDGWSGVPTLETNTTSAHCFGHWSPISSLSSFEAARCLINALMVTGGMSTVRLDLGVFGSFSLGPSLVHDNACTTCNLPRSKSMLSHDRADASCTRRPRVIDTVINAPLRWWSATLSKSLASATVSDRCSRSRFNPGGISATLAGFQVAYRRRIAKSKACDRILFDLGHHRL